MAVLIVLGKGLQQSLSQGKLGVAISPWLVWLIYGVLAFEVILILKFAPMAIRRWIKAPAKVGALPIPPLVIFQKLQLRHDNHKSALKADELTRQAMSDAQRRIEERKDEEYHQDKVQENIALGATLRASVPATLVKPKAIARFHILRGYEALARDDVPTAACHARLVLELEPWRSEALLLRAICRADNGERGWTTKFFELLTTRYDARNEWATAWLAYLDGDSRCEFWLVNLIRLRPQEAPVRALLAICQLASGRSRESLANIKGALDLMSEQSNLDSIMRQADEACYRFILATNLMKLGQLKDARFQLDWVVEHRKCTHAQGAQLIGLDAFAVDQEELKWQIAQGEYKIALLLAEELAAEKKAPKDQIAIGNVLWESFDDALLLFAQGCYERALQSGFYPNAKIAIAQIMAFRDENIAARALLLEALNTRVERPYDAARPETLLEWVFRELRKIDDTPQSVVTGWSVTLDVTGLKLQEDQLNLFCYAHDEIDARAQCEEIFVALLPDETVAERIQVSKACDANQRNQPMTPGLYRAIWGHTFF